jgi:hypothetical protein
MTRDELLKFHEEITKEARELMSKKNRDYAGKEGVEPFANFTRVESMGICKTEQGFMVRLTDKMSRLSSFVHAGKMNVQDVYVTGNQFDMALLLRGTANLKINNLGF